MGEHIGDLTPDPKNARRHNPQNVGMIASALQEVGAARSIVVDEDGVILAGNATVEAAAQVGIERLRVIDADGDEIIAVRRTGLTPSQKVRLALFDNRAAELAEWDTEQLSALAEEVELGGVFSDSDLADIFSASDDALSDSGEKYTTAAESPVYQPTDERPDVGDLVRLGRVEALLADIEASQVPEDVKAFLRAAAWRHAVFDYRRVAQFYAYADPVTQKLMEDSALVIIDVRRAIELGYARLRETMLELARDARDDG